MIAWTFKVPIVVAGSGCPSTLEKTRAYSGPIASSNVGHGEHLQIATDPIEGAFLCN